ncbi:DUF3267 domain-containing protein [Mariniphaga sediminis]|jgi:hypothetical protein|uniref:DUF3267 domain-containing protein n=1 Tax=Mariniphaga sediminis TaxID=1628158 RepID=A0A399D374_9BACT|nr:M50 family metallopeptidase [Mariniphaga sediminis]RIH66334.1 DUF3267 domain-containing protein [Mariniphaga sediminis]
MTRLRKIVSSLTFAGVIFHEFGHKFFCDITGVRVLKVCYFRFGNPSGYVIHERPKNFIQSFFIATGPLITGTLFALLFFDLATNRTMGVWQQVLFFWLGVSVAMNAFPSNTDAKSLWRDTNRHIRHNILAAFGYPFALVIWLANSLYLIWFDLIYALVLYYLVSSGLG